MKLAGIILIMIGIMALVYGGIVYTSKEKILEIGSVKVSAETKKRIPLPPIAGGAALIAGILMVAADRRKIR